MKAAVVGLGYAGLPLAIRLSQLNFDVLGIDINTRKISKLKSGKLPFAKDEPNLEKYFKTEYKRGKLLFTTSFQEISTQDLIFINVDTPISSINLNYSSLKSALRSISPNIKKNTIVIIESTIAPKTCDSIIKPLIIKYSNLHVNKEFFIVHAPERIRPKYIFKQLTTLPRVIGISSKKIKSKILNIYSQITKGEVDIVDIVTAEVVKTTENAYRDVNIAFSNEIAVACEELKVNVWDVRELINKAPLRDMHAPGAGVGGHCIPKDSLLLARSVKNSKMNLIKSSRNINNSMPLHMFILARNALKKLGKNIEEANVTILGYSFVENSDDYRNSPSQSLLRILDKYKIKYRVNDPYIEKYKNNIYEILKSSDCMLLMVGHRQYKKLDFNKIAKIMSTKIIIDGRNAFARKSLEKKGFIYQGIGNV